MNSKNSNEITAIINESLDASKRAYRLATSEAERMMHTGSIATLEALLIRLGELKVEESTAYAVT
jgi:hypothetical protein